MVKSVSRVVSKPVAAKPQELGALTGLRIIAAVWVVVLHLNGTWRTVWPGFPRGILVQSGYLAVDLFFVLSGLVLAHNYFDQFAADRGNYARFLIKRLARIYPLQLVTLGAAVLIFAIGWGALNPLLNGAIADVLLVRGWFGPQIGWNYPAWSLSAEWLAYLLFPVVVAVVAWAGRRSIWGLLALMGGLIIIDAYGAAQYPGLNDLAVSPIRVMTAFAAGVALARFAPCLLSAPHWLRWVAGTGAVAAMVVLMLKVSDFDRSWLQEGVGVLCALTIISGFAYGTGPFVWFFASVPMRYGGRVSFALYLVHAPVSSVLGHLITPKLCTAWVAWQRMLLLAGMIAVVGGVAVLTHHLVEVPAARLISRWAPKASKWPAVVTSIEQHSACQVSDDTTGLLDSEYRALQLPQPIQVIRAE